VNAARSTPDDARVVLDVEGVTKRFGAVTALKDVDMVVRAGEVLGLIGDNGAGKSTLVGVISGAQRPDDGRVLVDGVEHHFHSPAEARAVGIETIFQNLALVPTLNIAENVYLKREVFGPGRAGRWIRRMNKRAMRRETAKGLERFGVALPPVKTKAAALSGGQRQAVAIARAVLWGSHIVVMDEPAAALGVKQTELVLSFVERLKSHGVAVVFISHNMQHVLRVSDRIVVMRLGAKVADLAVDEQLTDHQLVVLMTGVGAAAGSAAT
jgi:ABC-type sugar transport system ATPase subunit